MLRVKSAISSVCLALTLWTTADLRAQIKAPAPDAPLPSALLTAKKAFISFAGGEPYSLRGPRQVYNQFFAEIKASGRYQLVRSPGEADLVLQLSFANPMSKVSVSPGAGGSWGSSSSQPQFRLVLLDPRTSIVLWTIIDDVPSAMLPENRDKNLDNTLHRLAQDLEALTAPSTAN